MIAPTPYKLVCLKCGYSKLVAPQSDCLSPKDLMSMSPICSKCKGQMERKSFNILDNIFNTKVKSSSNCIKGIYCCGISNNTENKGNTYLVKSISYLNIFKKFEAFNVVPLENTIDNTG